MTFRCAFWLNSPAPWYMTKLTCPFTHSDFCHSEERSEGRRSCLFCEGAARSSGAGISLSRAESRADRCRSAARFRRFRGDPSADGCRHRDDVPGEWECRFCEGSLRFCRVLWFMPLYGHPPIDGCVQDVKAAFNWRNRSRISGARGALSGMTGRWGALRLLNL